MAVLNELISEVKFIKFFAWEDRWIARAIKAREKELNWLIKERLNSIVFYLLWMLSPVCVSIVSFTVFVAIGGKLTVSVAFTAIQLFNMIKMYVRVLPSCI
jgi:ABC-type multidrug transport system fused ATPase/permease subunit